MYYKSTDNLRNTLKHYGRKGMRRGRHLPGTTWWQEGAIAGGRTANSSEPGVRGAIRGAQDRIKKPEIVEYNPEYLKRYKRPDARDEGSDTGARWRAFTKDRIHRQMLKNEKTSAGIKDGTKRVKKPIPDDLDPGNDNGTVTPYTWKKHLEDRVKKGADYIEREQDKNKERIHLKRDEEIRKVKDRIKEKEKEREREKEIEKRQKERMVQRFEDKIGAEVKRIKEHKGLAWVRKQLDSDEIKRRKRIRDQLKGR